MTKMKFANAIKTVIFLSACLLGNPSQANVYHVNVVGNDRLGNGSAANPWRTLKHAVAQVRVRQGDTVLLGAGVFVEEGPIDIPLGVSIQGTGINVTVLKPAASFYYHPANPGYAFDKFLMRLLSTRAADGNQSLKHFSIDGESKQLHGGIFVRNRNNVIIDSVKVEYTNYNGIWLWNSRNSKIMNTRLLNCSWGSSSYCTGALNLGNLEFVEIKNLDVNENTGYGIKAIGPDSINHMRRVVIHDSRVSVNPRGLWNNGQAPNIAIEFWQVNLVECEIYDTYVDNTISLVNSLALPPTGVRTIRVHDNIFDMVTRAKGAGYGLELSIHDAEIDHNYFIKGRYGIANWTHAMQNWNIHHNIFYGIEGIFPGDVLRSQWSGLHNVRFWNNTVEFAGDKTMNVIGLYGGSSENVAIVNNLFINNNTSYNYYPNSLVHLEGGAITVNFQVKNNVFDKLNIGQIPGADSSNNVRATRHITGKGKRPDPYYRPRDGGRLIDAGVSIGFFYTGSAPDIGAFEYVPPAPAQSARMNPDGK